MYLVLSSAVNELIAASITVIITSNAWPKQILNWQHYLLSSFFNNNNTKQNSNRIKCSSWDIHIIYYIPNCKRPITSHHSYHVTVQYPTVLYGCYWTVVIAQLSAVDLPSKVNDKSRWQRKESEWGAGSFRVIVCKQNTSVNILFIKQYNYLRPSISDDELISDSEPYKLNKT